MPFETYAVSTYNEDGKDAVANEINDVYNSVAERGGKIVVHHIMKMPNWNPGSVGTRNPTYNGDPCDHAVIVAELPPFNEN